MSLRTFVHSIDFSKLAMCTVLKSITGWVMKMQIILKISKATTSWWHENKVSPLKGSLSPLSQSQCPASLQINFDLVDLVDFRVKQIIEIWYNDFNSEVYLNPKMAQVVFPYFQLDI